ncbi:MAG: hypothetical protein Q7K13_05915 [Polynucleobacter sp.]|uniref:hypothetical protein n=1 Tax=Polynucleobacter sp. TaxID=2029855 RepID=UPI002719D2D0|nr:hypothetical protein [Polynucleobacter sp.]MDO8713998.1 hypothetical protein [Polynucleobacter sp.]
MENKNNSTAIDFSNKSFSEIITEVNGLAHKLAKSMGWDTPQDTKFYTPAESNGPLKEHRAPMYWALAVVSYEHITSICVESVLEDFLASQHSVDRKSSRGQTP